MFILDIFECSNIHHNSIIVKVIRANKWKDNKQDKISKQSTYLFTERVYIENFEIVIFMYMKEHIKDRCIKEYDDAWWNFTSIYFLPIKKDSN